MFTGIIKAICTVRAIRPAGGGMILSADLGKLAKQVKLGDSVAINGTCLTATKLAAATIDFDVSAETLTKSTTSRLKPGSKVNTELAMPADGRFGGHIVQGHIDGTATIKSIDRKGEFYTIVFTAAADILDGLVQKGSVAIDGVSLTVAAVDANSFTVAIIPATWQNTIFNLAKTGDIVNIELDIMCKMVQSQLKKMLSDTSSLTVDKLRQMGF